MALSFAQKTSPIVGDYERKAMNPKIQKFLLKAGISAVFALAMGYTYKAELKLEDKVDEKYKKQQADATAS